MKVSMGSSGEARGGKLVTNKYLDLFQMSGKRTRSYRCAVHHRDREVSSENDFHLLLEDPTFFAR